MDRFFVVENSRQCIDRLTIRSILAIRLSVVVNR